MTAQKVKVQTDAQVKQATASQAQTELEQLRAKVAELEQAILEKDAAHKRAYADYLNLQRRTKEDQERFVRFAAATLIEKLLEPMDHLVMAATHINDKALSMIVKQLQSALQQEGLQEIDALGKSFDSRTMEAADTVEGEKGVVMNIRRSGYTLNGIMVRPALVEVGNGSKPTTSDASIQAK